MLMKTLIPPIAIFILLVLITHSVSLAVAIGIAELLVVLVVRRIYKTRANPGTIVL